MDWHCSITADMEEFLCVGHLAANVIGVMARRALRSRSQKWTGLYSRALLQARIVLLALVSVRAITRAKNCGACCREKTLLNSGIFRIMVARAE